MKLITFALAGLLCAVGATHAQDKPYPTRPVTIYVPFTAGPGGSPARFFADQLAKALNGSFVVENKPGASGIIAVTAVKNAPADGHAILLASNSPISVNPVTIKDLPYDPLRDLKPIAGMTRSMNALVVAPNSPIRTLADLVDRSKRKPAMIGTYSDGYRLALEWLSSLTGAKFQNVPYKGGSPVFTDVMGGHVDAGVVELAGAWELIRSGKLRALTVSGEARHKDFPNVPTVRESGYPEYVNYSWTSFYVRAETPDHITKKLADAMQVALQSPSARDFIKTTGRELMPYTPERMRDYQNAEIARFRAIAESAGIKPQ